MNSIFFRTRAFLTAVLLSALIMGIGIQPIFGRSSDGKIPVFTPSGFSISNKFPAIYYIFDFKKEKNGKIPELLSSECGDEKCEFKFHYNGMNSDSWVVDPGDENTYWNFHIGFFNFANNSGAYAEDYESQFLLLRMYINAKMSKDFGFGYIGIANCKELGVCGHLAELAKKKSIDYKSYKKNVELLSNYKNGNEAVFERINNALEVLLSLDEMRGDGNG